MLIYFLLLNLCAITLQKENVYFTKTISSSNMVKLFKQLNVNLTGNICLKVHSGEEGGQYFLRPDFLQEIYDYIKNGTFVETNTAYNGGRNTTERHQKLLKDHGWLEGNRRMIIMDEKPEEDFTLNVANYKMISKNYVGSHLKDFDSCLVLSHFKGHSIGGFGGALKQLSIGFASKQGKKWIHYTGSNTSANQENFTAAMGDAASTIVDYFRSKGKIAFINVMANISLRCDCAGGSAPVPKIHDMGILASLDPVALDRACLDIIKSHTDVGTNEWLEQLENKKGENTVYVAEQHGIGSQEYILVDLDKGNEDLNNNSLIIIIVVIVLILLLVCIGGFIFYKRRNKSSDNNLDRVLNENENDDNNQN